MFTVKLSVLQTKIKNKNKSTKTIKLIKSVYDRAFTVEQTRQSQLQSL